MKKIVYPLFTITLLLGIVWSSLSCQRIDKLTQFHINVSDTVTIPSMTGINFPFNFLTPPITTNSSNVFDTHNTRKDLIEEVKIESLILKITVPEDENFSFLNSIEVFIETDSIEATMIAWKYEIENTIGNTIDLEVSGEDLTKYLIEDQLYLKVKTITDKIVNSDVDIEIVAKFFINAKILGI